MWNEATPGAAFCSRCGTRATQPRPAAVREYALSRILPSWWHFTREVAIAIAMLGGGAYLWAAIRATRPAASCW